MITRIEGARFFLHLCSKTSGRFSDLVRGEVGKLPFMERQILELYYGLCPLGRVSRKEVMRSLRIGSLKAFEKHHRQALQRLSATLF